MMELYSKVSVSFQNPLQNSTLCEGSIINSLLILTAARCAIEFSKWTIGLTTSPSSQTRRISNVFIHEGFSANFTPILNDIAIVVLDSPLAFNADVQPVEFPSHRDEVAELATTDGWGILAYGWSSGILKRPRQPNTAKLKGNQTFIEIARCEGNNATGLCQGYMGGAILCKTKNSSNIVLCGIQSFNFGFDSDGGDEYSNIFTEVIFHLNWIMEKSSCICNQDFNTIQRNQCTLSYDKVPDENLCIYPSCQGGALSKNNPWNVVRHNFYVYYITGAPDGVNVSHILTVNGQFPAPTIRAVVGDLIEIRVLNYIQNRQNLTIHWHGISQIGTPFEDGPSQMAQCPIKSGKEQVYRFPVRHAGTFWYHSHVQSQYTEGLWGILIVHKRREYYYYDAEFVIPLNEWYRNNSIANEKWYLSPNSKGSPPFPSSGLMNGMGRFNCSLDFDKCSELHQFRPVFNLRRNEVYKLRLINVGGWATYNFSIDGHTLLAVEVDGIETKQAVSSKGIYIGAGQRYSLIIEKDKDEPFSEFLIRATIRTEYLFRREGVININPNWNYLLHEITGLIRYTTSTDLQHETEHWRKLVQVSQNYAITEITPVKESFSYKEAIPEAQGNINFLQSQDLNPVERVRAPEKYDKRFFLNLTFSDAFNDGVIRASFNYTPFRLPFGKPLLLKVLGDEAVPANTLNLTVEYGDVVDVVLNNVFNGSHPIHLHGHHFWVIGTGQANDGVYNESVHGVDLQSIRRDTVMVKHRSYVIIRFVADNPGVWALHCHIDWHNLSGMRVAIVEAPQLARKLFYVKEEIAQQCKDHGISVESGRSKPKQISDCVVSTPEFGVEETTDAVSIQEVTTSANQSITQKIAEIETTTTDEVPLSSTTIALTSATPTYSSSVTQVPEYKFPQTTTPFTSTTSPPPRLNKKFVPMNFRIILRDLPDHDGGVILTWQKRPDPFIKVWMKGYKNLLWMNGELVVENYINSGYVLLEKTAHMYDVPHADWTLTKAFPLLIGEGKPVAEKQILTVEVWDKDVNFDDSMFEARLDLSALSDNYGRLNHNFTEENPAIFEHNHCCPKGPKLIFKGWLNTKKLWEVFPTGFP